MICCFQNKSENDQLISKQVILVYFPYTKNQPVPWGLKIILQLLEKWKNWRITMKNIFSPSLFDNVPIRLSTIFCSPSHPVKNHEVSFNLHVMHNRNRIIQSRSYLAGETSAKEKYYSKKLFSFQLSKCSVTEWLK